MKDIIDRIDEKMQILITMFIIFFLSTTVCTYLYYYFSNDVNKNSSIVKLNLEVEQVLPFGNNKNKNSLHFYKMMDSSEDVLLLAALKNGCLDSDKNVICRVYKISVENTSTSITQDIDGSISFYADSKLETDVNYSSSKLYWRLIENFNEKDVLKSDLGTNENNIASFNSSFFVRNVSLEKEKVMDYYLLVWGNDVLKVVDSIDSYFIKVQIDSSNGTNITSIFEG